MPTLIEDLERIEDELTALDKESNNPEIEASLSRAKEAAEEAHKAFSQSWLGYHSHVYYKDLQPPPPGAHFSVEWGLAGRMANDTTGEWVEYDVHQIHELLKAQAGSPSIDELCDSAPAVARKAIEYKEELISILDACLGRNEDAYLAKLKKQAEGARLRSVDECLNRYKPSGRFHSCDRIAITHGIQIPPHFNLLAQVEAIKSGFALPSVLAVIAKRAASHLSKKDRAKGISAKQGTKVFIGHGGSAAWRELKDFIQDRLGLEIDEFNRKPIAGVTNITRLSEMLEDAAIAFLVMTAEDEQKDGKMHARQNVIHEAGLFQGKLGFPRAIVVLEDGCEAFSNIDGLGQLRFPAKKIKAIFDDVRQVLEREGILQPMPVGK